MKPNSKYLKVKRTETHTIPKGTRKAFNSLDTFSRLIVVLQNENKKECGFTHFALPNIEWMLRMLIWAKPELRDEIFNQ